MVIFTSYVAVGSVEYVLSFGIHQQKWIRKCGKPFPKPNAMDHPRFEFIKLDIQYVVGKLLVAPNRSLHSPLDRLETKLSSWGPTSHKQKNNWLVVYLPLWKIWKSDWIIIPIIGENKSYVPNHQPGCQVGAPHPENKQAVGLSFVDTLRREVILWCQVGVRKRPGKPACHRIVEHALG